MLGCSLFSLPLVALGLDPSLVVILVAAFIAGMGMEIFGIGWNLAMQENIDESMLSRAYSYDMLGSFVAIPVGQLLFGPLGARWGVPDVILWAGVAYAAKIGSASCRERVCQYVSISAVAATLKKKKKTNTH